MTTVMTIVYNKRVYERVPANAPEFEQELVEDPVEKQKQYEATQLLTEDEVIPPMKPLKLMRMTQPREESVLLYDEESGEVSVNPSHKIHVTGYVPYTWVPVSFYGTGTQVSFHGRDEITWFREK